ncbi:hypothetical protein C0995_007104 [Termitomyces sp. Mi166|nr:hypothetical protein C0995_007104 [Termitomyces sp. Mi166\
MCYWNLNIWTGTGESKIPGQDKGKGPDPCNWGDANLTSDELDSDVQHQILEACNRQQHKSKPGLSSDGGKAAASSDYNESDMDDEMQPTWAELKEHLRLKHELERDIHKLQKELQKERRTKVHSWHAGSEPISNKLQDMIDQVTQRAQHLKGRPDAKESSSRRLKPINQVTKDSALGRAFDCIKGHNSPEPSDSSLLDSSDMSSSDSSDSEYIPGGQSDSSGLDSSSDDSEYVHDRPKKKSSEHQASRRKQRKIPKLLIKPTPPAKYGGAPNLQAFLQFMTHCTSYVKYGLVQKECQDYIGELQELFTIVGSTHRKEKVVKLFNGFRPSIQQELYCLGLNPKTSKWKKVVSKAEFIEMAEIMDLEFGDGQHSGSHNNRMDDRNNGGSKCPGNYKGKGSPYSNSVKKRSKSPSSFGRKTNGFSSNKGHSCGFKPQKPRTDSSKSKALEEHKHLSKEEEAEYHAQDWCFKCGEIGHMAHNCACGKHASSSNPGKLPGLKSYSIKVDLCETDRLRKEALGQTMTGVFIGMVMIPEVPMGEGPPYEGLSITPVSVNGPPGFRGHTIKGIKEEEEDLPDLREISDAEAAGPDYDYDEIPGRYNPENENSVCYNKVEEDRDSPPRASLDSGLNLEVEEPIGHYVDEEGEPRKVWLIVERDFNEDSYDFVVSNSDEKIELV